MPVLQLVMFGYVVGADITDVTTAIVDHDRTPLSRELTDAVAGSGYFDIVEHPADERAAARAHGLAARYRSAS